MKILGCHKGHRIARPNWPKDAYFDVLIVTNHTITVRDECSRIIMFDRDDSDNWWKHLGIFKSPPKK